VFSNGLGAPIALWNDVQADLDTVTRTIAYDRAGTFGSGPMTEAPTLKQIVSDLHELLMKIDARPPYVLVGHSYGGVIIHTFAALYRSEVVGLVYVDSIDFNQTAEDERAVLEKAGVNGSSSSRRRKMRLTAASVFRAIPVIRTQFSGNSRPNSPVSRRLRISA
jgi:pimeloyl-ACP methyl ester carboxylesterase